MMVKVQSQLEKDFSNKIVFLQKIQIPLQFKRKIFRKEINSKLTLFKIKVQLQFKGNNSKKIVKFLHMTKVQL